MTRGRPDWTPAPREGVGASRVGVGDDRFATVADFLVARFPAVADWPARLARGAVLDAAGRPLHAGAACTAGMLIWYWRDPPPEPRVPFEIGLLHRDAHLVVVDKPHFLPVTPGGRHLQETVLVRLRRQLGIDTLVPMHRLDRDTAGVMALIVRPEDRHAYHCLLRDRLARKVYEAVAPRHAGTGPDADADPALPLIRRSRMEAGTGADFMQMREVGGPPNAETRIERVGPATGPSPGPWSLYRLEPHTGRKHQLRLHMSALGLPIAGDRIYPRLLPEPPADAAPDYSQPLQLLARELCFVDPVTGEPRRFTSRLRLAHAPADRA